MAKAVGGIVTFTNLVDDTAESISLQFSGDQLNVGPSNNIVVSPDTPFRLVIHTQPSSTATAGLPFANQPVVYEVDQFGNLETADNSTLLTAALATGNGPLQGTTAITLSGGIATYANLANNSAGAMSLVFSGAGLSAGPSSNVTVSPGPATQLVIQTQPDASVVAGIPLKDPVVIDEKDQYGNIETGDSSTVVTVALATGVGPLQGTFTATVSGGIATFTNLGDDTAETITLKFSSGNLTPATSAGIVVSPAAASKLVVTQQPSSAATAGASFITQPVVKEEDQFGNVITSDSTNSVTVARGSLGTAALQGTNLKVTLSSGVATFSGLSYDKAESMNLGFSTNANGVSAASSNTVAVSPTAINQLVINQQPSTSASTGQPFATQPVIYEEDQFNNLESGDNTTVIAATLLGGAGPLQGTTTATVSGGVARFSNLGDNTAETISLDFTTGSLASPLSNSIVVSPGPAAKLVIHTEPSSNATAGHAFTIQPVIYIVDSYGNLETGDNSSVVTASLSSGTGPLGGTVMAKAVGGIVTFTNLVDDTAESISLQFSGDQLNVGPSNNIVVSPDTPFRLVIHTQPSSTATAGLPFANQPVVYEVDQFGNLETADNSTLLTAALATGNGPLQGTTAITLSGGIATYANLANNSAGAMSLVFSGAGLSAGPSSNVTVSPGPATQLVIQTQPDASVVAGIPLKDPVVIDEEDQYGNIETGDNSTVVTVSLASGVGAAPRHSHRHRLRRNRHLHQPRRRHGRDHHAQVLQRQPHPGHVGGHRRQPRRGQQARRHPAAVFDGDSRRRPSPPSRSSRKKTSSETSSPPTAPTPSPWRAARSERPPSRAPI